MPAITVEVAFDSGFSTPIADRTYTDVSVEAQNAISITHGRDDELATPPPGRCSLTLDNRDGRFTPEKASSPYYPNIKKGKPIRVSVRYADEGAGNLLTANQASMETSVADWSMVGGGSVASSAVRAQAGTKSLLVTWPTTGGLVYSQTVATGLSIGATYTASAYVYVPAGSPAVRLDAFGVQAGSASTATAVWQRLSVTFVATGATVALIVIPTSAPTAGQQVWVDAVMLDEGSTVGTFTTTAPPIHRRFTGYIDEWPLSWPDGSDAVSHMTISCSTRRARLGNTAPLTSAIRAAYLATDPDAYWPMDEDTGVVDAAGRQAFRDITNETGRRDKEVIASFYNTEALKPVVRDGSAGPTDEESLVKIPSYSDAALLLTFPHYVGAGTAVKVNTAGEFTVEVVGRIQHSGPFGVTTWITPIFIGSAMQDQIITLYVTGAIGSPEFGRLNLELVHRNPETWAINDAPTWPFPATTPDEYEVAVDGELHHYAVTLSGGNAAKMYFDGALITTVTLAAPFTFDTRFTNITTGSETYNAHLWAGHMAVHDRTLTAAEILAHADAALASSETVEDRVIRVAGRVGVPADEIVVEDTIAPNLGSQPEAGRSAAEVLDEVAASTSGILYDTREGLLAMQARNHRYNPTSAFSLSATAQEVQGDLSGVLDDRYLTNTVDATRAASSEAPFTAIDQDSIDEYGVYAKQVQIVAGSDLEVESAAQNLINRYAEPRLRVPTVSMDLLNLSTAQRTAALTADIGTMFNVTALPVQAPTDPLPLFIEGYTETFDSVSHFLTANTTPAVNTAAWVLGDATLGVLGSTTILAY